MALKISAWRMSSVGNRFLILDTRGTPLRQPDASLLPQPFDQLILIRKPTERADAAISIINKDNSPARACGNGTRCVAHLLMDTKNTVLIQTDNAAISCQKNNGHISAHMGVPRFGWRDIPLQKKSSTDNVILQKKLPPAALVNVGNPHAVFFVPQKPEKFLGSSLSSLTTLGPTLAQHPIFCEGANISFAHVRDPHNAFVRHWERGAGKTPSCGTAACAVAACARRYHKIKNPLTVHFRGGSLTVRWENSSLWLTGPTTLEEIFTVTVP